MPHKPRASRILAIDLRLERFGYAVFEGPSRMVDWGVCLYGSSGGPTAARKRLAPLLKQFLPSSIAVSTILTEKALGRHGVRRILTAIRREASVHTVPVQMIEKVRVRKVFRSLHAKTKHEIASAVAKLFPELRWKLPPKRKVWQKEHYRIAMFEAVAVGYVYWQLTAAHGPVLKGE
jgi:hypothetical protein